MGSVKIPAHRGSGILEWSLGRTIGDVCLAASLLGICPPGTIYLDLFAQMFKQEYFLQNYL